MTSTARATSALWLSFLLLLIPLYAFAQAQASGDETLEDFTEEEVSMPVGTVSCFDYYSFGSVQTDLHTAAKSAVSGTPVTFSGTIRNNNPYPIVDGSLYVKVFHYYTHDKNIYGPDVVDQNTVLSDLSIPAHGSIPVSFTWQVPAYAESGDYALGTYFLTSRKSNLLGLSFTDDVVGNTVPFSIIGDSVSGVGFDKTSVTVGGMPYFFAASPPIVGTSEPVTIAAEAGNPTDTDQQALISWQIYQWDSQLRENVVKEESRTVTLPAHETVPVSITVDNDEYPVYLAVGTLSWQDTRSIINVRFVRNDVNRLRINFPSVTDFPLTAGTSDTLFSCLHNSGTADSVPGGRLDLTLSDRDGNMIHEYSYSGDVTGAMMGIASQFTPKKDYDYVRLDARLYQNGEFVDEASLVYDCNAIDPTSCLPQTGPSVQELLEQYQSLLAIGGGILLLLIVISIYNALKPRAPKPRPLNTTM